MTSNELTHELLVDASHIDANGHVNNVHFVQWMQDIAVRHSNTTGCTDATRAAGLMWVARSHRIEYVRPAFVGDCILVRTWVASFRRAFSLRRYRFTRVGDNVELARGQTNWVLIDATNGRPKSIPPEIVGMFFPSALRQASER